MSLAFFATASPSGSDEARADQAIDRAERGAAGRSAHHPEYIPIAHSVAAATVHHSNRTISSSQRMFRRTSTSAATVPTAVGSGVTPKVSAVVHGRPAIGASSGYPTTQIASNAVTIQNPLPCGGENAILPAKIPRPTRSSASSAKAAANHVAIQLIWA